MQIATMRLWKPSTLIGEGNRGLFSARKVMTRIRSECHRSN